MGKPPPRPYLPHMVYLIAGFEPAAPDYASHRHRTIAVFSRVMAKVRT